MDDDEIKKLWNRCVDETPMPTDAGDVAIRLYRMAERSKKPNYCDMEKAAYENHKAFHPDGTTHICYFCDCEKQARASARAELIEKLKDELNNHTLQLTNNKRKLFIETKDMWAAIKKASESLGEHGGLADGIGDKRCGKSNTRQSSSKDAGYKRSASPPSNPKPEKPELVYYDLMHCDRCIQETNHRNGVCQKCKPKKQRRRNGGYKGRL